MNCPVKNESKTDRVIRLGIGIISFLGGYFALTGLSQTLAYVVGFLGIFTGLTGFCLIYRLLGISTQRNSK